MRVMKWSVLMSAFCLLMSQPAWAVRTSVHEAAESQEYGRKFGGMISRGALNLSTCFVDLLVNVVNETRSGPPLVGTLVGIGKGAGCTLLRALSGGVDLITFWVPGFNGFAVSDAYENCVILSSTPAVPAVSETAPRAPTVGRPASPPPAPVMGAPKPERPRDTK